MIGGNTIALMGLGLSGELAGIIGADYQLAVGVGTAQVGAKALIGDNVELSVSVGQTAVVLPTVQAIAEPVFTANASATATSALVFVPVGHTLNGALNASLAVPQNKAAIFWQYKSKFWASILSA